MQTLHLTIQSQKLADLTGFDIKTSIKHHYTKNAIPDVIGFPIGKLYIESNRKESYIVKDKENNNTDILDACIKTDKLLEKHTNAFTKNEQLEHIIIYCIGYDVDESTKHKPTEIRSIVGDATPIDEHHVCDIELLFSTGDNYTRRITVTTTSTNLSFFEMLTNIHEELEELYNTGKSEQYEELNKLIKITPYQERQILMFDSIGTPEEIVFSDMDELKAMLVGARMTNITTLNIKQKG